VHFPYFCSFFQIDRRPSGAYRNTERTKDHEQMIRGSGATANWIVPVSGYNTHALRELMGHELAVSKVVNAGATPAQIIGAYGLFFTLIAHLRT
jgi:hypothetical protein